MDPVVTAAAIGIGGTVIVGVAGFSAAIWTTRRTIAHARESRVWDRRADAYAETLAETAYWRVRREYDMWVFPLSDKGRENAKAVLDTHEPAGWDQRAARMQAFASLPVFKAMQANNAAHLQAMRAFRSRLAVDSTDSAADQSAAKAVAEALKAADEAASVLIVLIRDELQAHAERSDRRSAKRLTQLRNFSRGPGT